MRKIFGTDGVRGEANQYPMTPEIALQLGRAIAYIFRNHGKKSRILIGKDTRLSGYLFETALSSGICSMGADVLLVGPVSTPGIAYMTVGMRADAGCVISASHNPFYDNGIKFFGRDGFKLPDELEEDIEELLFSETLVKNLAAREEIGRAHRIDDAVGRYIVYLKNIFPKNLSLEGIKIVVDAANGADYKAAPRVFEELGADVIAINCSPDGTNINEECGSLFPVKLSETVLRENADFGLALDGDGDRAVLCDENGNIIDGDLIMAVCAKRMNRLGILKKSTLVGTVMSNYGLETALKKAGIKLLRTDVGDRYVVDEG
ncbi:MAG: phosphoglucosamine mutase, partial [Deltaproteobacteria bacterium]|nr:phosphoglucosamine mutase [Deltaproteobacteria bacterium]